VVATKQSVGAATLPNKRGVEVKTMEKSQKWARRTWYFTSFSRFPKEVGVLTNFASRYLYGSEIPTLLELDKAYHLTKSTFRVRFCSGVGAASAVYIFTSQSCHKKTTRYAIAFRISLANDGEVLNIERTKHKIGSCPFRQK